MSTDADWKEMDTTVRKLILAAANAPDSGDAMKFAQAALNAANALRTLTDNETARKTV
jgi:hypothetical protein